jgi:SAM-dependent methyltransferase
MANYSTCDSCGSLHVVQPHWLAEAYADPASADKLDEGALWRNATVGRLLRGLSVPPGPWLDYGSGQGLLRRSVGVELQQFDPFRGNPQVPHGKFAVVACLEVLEHTTTPAQLLTTLAQLVREDGVIALSTWLREPSHGASWEYLACIAGQHVTFPSRAGFSILCCGVGLKWLVSAVSTEHRSLQVHLLSPSALDVVDAVKKAGFEAHASVTG